MQVMSTKACFGVIDIEIKAFCSFHSACANELDKQRLLECEAVNQKQPSQNHCRQQVGRTIHSWETHDKEHCAMGVCNVSDEDLVDQTKHFFNHCNRDLIYSGLNVEFAKHFLVKNKKKVDGKLRGLMT